MRYLKLYKQFESSEFLKNYKIIDKEMPLPKDIIDISKEYFKNDKQLYVVGGAVRDFLQNKVPHDYDLTTNALPNESKEILKNFSVSDEQGKKFGVIRVYTKDTPEGHEIATFRKDISGGRDVKGDDDKVEIGQHITIEDDCNRRDLTINAIFYDINKKQIIDLVGGVDDIKSNIIRSVGDPKKRFEEDRLRILRVIRFSSRIDGKIDEETSNAIKSDNRLRNISIKDDVSQERIWDEMAKAFKESKDYNYYLNLLTYYDMWKEIFPKSNINTNLIDSKNFLIIISNLFKNDDLNKFEDKLILDYKIKSKTAEKIHFLVSLKYFNEKSVLSEYKKKLQCGIKDSTILEWVEKQDDLDKKKLKAFVFYRPSVSALDLIKIGFKGKKLGDELNKLEYEAFLKSFN
jgi:tRNA nucleotidyltransferase/poly(A) polymerase